MYPATVAARRSGLSTVILPEANRKNVGEIPRALRRSMRFIFVADVREVFEAALLPGPAQPLVSRQTSGSRVQPAH